jgi:hypothetical protein
MTNTTVVAQSDNTKANVSVTATSEQSIKALILAVSAAIAGGQNGVGVAGSGVFARNKIASDPTAKIVGGDIKADQITVAAKDDSQIDAFAGAAAVSAAIGSSAGVAISIGISLAFNEVSNQVKAYVDGAKISETGGLNVSAEVLPADSFFAAQGALTAARLDDVVTTDMRPEYETAALELADVPKIDSDGNIVRTDVIDERDVADDLAILTELVTFMNANLSVADAIPTALAGS